MSRLVNFFRFDFHETEEYNNSMKTCRRCNVEKPSKDFYKNKNNSDGLQGYCKKCSRDGVKAHRKENPDRWAEYYRREYDKRKNDPAYQEYQRQYRELNRDRIRESCRIYYENNGGQWSAYRQTRRARERAGGSFTYEEWVNLCEKYGGKCLKCGAPECTIDHVVPLSKGGSNDISNIQPLCLNCNLRKKDKIADYRV